MIKKAVHYKFQYCNSWWCILPQNLVSICTPSIEEFCCQHRTQKEPVFQFTRNTITGRNTAKPKIIKAWKSMKSILSAFSLSVGAEHLLQSREFILQRLQHELLQLRWASSSIPAPRNCYSPLPGIFKTHLRIFLFSSLNPCATLWLLTIRHQAQCQLDSSPVSKHVYIWICWKLYSIPFSWKWVYQKKPAKDEPVWKVRF